LFEGRDPAWLKRAKPFRWAARGGVAKGISRLLAPGAERTGLGLGLAIVKELVDLHGGTVAVESAGENRGATFRAALPVAAAQVSYAI
jgi:signal transduction histidine kinase